MSDIKIDDLADLVSTAVASYASLDGQSLVDDLQKADGGANFLPFKPIDLVIGLT